MVEKRVYDTGEEFLNVRKDRKEIERIIRINLPLMNKNESMCQNIADAILLYFIEKQEVNLPKGFKEGTCKCGRKYGFIGLDFGYCVKCLDAMEVEK